MAGPPTTPSDACASAGEPYAGARQAGGALRSLGAGGTEGNELLTTLTGLLLIIVLAVEGVTIVRIGQLLWLHLFVGMALLGPVALKLVSTGYRFARYYTFDGEYRRKGPPPAVLRGLAPFVVLTTLGVMGTGIALLVIGPSSRTPLVEVHKITFIVWIVVTALHVLGHLPDVARLFGSSAGAGVAARIPSVGRVAARIPSVGHDAAQLPSVSVGRDDVPGAVGRWLSLGTALALGLVLAAAVIPLFHAWMH